MAAMNNNSDSVISHKPLSGKRRRTNVHSDQDLTPTENSNSTFHNSSGSAVCSNDTLERTDLSFLSGTDDHTTPLVFICSGCEAIFGDSIDWVRHDDDLATITLKRECTKVKFEYYGKLYLFYMLYRPLTSTPKLWQLM